MKLSVVISAHNEEKNLQDCLESLGFADEIIVVDHESTDGTAKLAKKLGATVFSHPNDPANIDVQKNIGFKKAKGEWILSLDADERIPSELAKEIQTAIDNSHHTAFRIPRKNIIFGKWIEHSIWWPDYQVRLFQSGKGEYKEQNVHKQLHVDGTIGQLENPLLHENYQTVSQYLQKMDVYTENEAQALIKQNSHFTWIDGLRMPVRDFLKTFFLQQGYKDGFHGLVLSFLQSFYTFLVVIKVWEKNGFREENDKDFLQTLLKEWQKLQKEISYWFLTSFIEISNPIKKIPYKLKRKYITRTLEK